jgi:hypothetical protein
MFNCRKGGGWAIFDSPGSVRRWLGSVLGFFWWLRRGYCTSIGCVKRAGWARASKWSAHSKARPCVHSCGVLSRLHCVGTYLVQELSRYSSESEDPVKVRRQHDDTNPP